MHGKGRFNVPGLYVILLFLSLTVIQHSLLAENAITATVVTTNSSTAVPAEPSAETSQDSLAPVQVGPLEIIPAKVFIRVPKCNGTSKCIVTNVRFKIKNTSASDVKFILFQNSIVVTDNFGSQLYTEHKIQGGGVNLSKAKSGNYQSAFLDEKNNFTILSAKRSVEVQLIPEGSGYEYTRDTLDFYINHKPKTMTLSAVIGIQTIEETSQIHSFSLSNIPIQINE